MDAIITMSCLMIVASILFLTSVYYQQKRDKEYRRQVAEKISESEKRKRRMIMKDKIEVLSDYMNELDERLFVYGNIKLCFMDYESENIFELAIAREGKLITMLPGSASKDLFNELSQYNDDFFKKYNELLSEEDNEMDYIDRMKVELSELKERIDKLERYDDKDTLMNLQLVKMIEYRLILEERLRQVEGE